MGGTAADMEPIRPIRTIAYVDGFNLYYRALKGTPYKWLDLDRLLRLIFPSHHFERIRYFTALISSRPDDPTQAQRQQAYLRALGTLPNVEVQYGQFLTNPTRLAYVAPPNPWEKTVEVYKTDEKGSDVNLATSLLLDAFDRDFEKAVVVSHDSDLVAPIRAVRDRLNMHVGVLDPATRASKELLGASSFYRRLRAGPLSAAQFEPTLTDAIGTITKPEGW